MNNHKAWMAAALLAAAGCAGFDASAPVPPDTLVQEVRGRLEADPVTRDARIGVQLASGGQIVLRGRVPNMAVGARAVAVAQGTPGVVSVRDDLIAQP
jgi:osmotically-inducible protein OsmY